MREDDSNKEKVSDYYVTMSETEYKKVKLRLQELKQKTGKMVKLFSFVIFCVSLVFTLFFFFDSYNKITLPNVAISVIISLVVASFCATYLSLYNELKESGLRGKVLEYEAEHIKDDIEEDIFENSIKMSYKYLDQYYLQTREQAQRGFFVTVCVAIFGALLIGVGIVAMFLGLSQPSVVTCAAGVITEFIAAVFFYLYNRTISSMSKYHNKLVLSQNVSIALKIADSLPDQDKVKTKNLIVTELLKDINNHLVKEDASSPN